MTLSLGVAGCDSMANAGKPDGACLYRIKDEQHDTKWASCTLPPPRANLMLMDPRTTPR